MADAVSNVPVPAGGGEEKKPLLGLSFLENLSEMSMLRQIGLLVGLAASVAIGFAVVLWSQQPDYRPLLGSLAGMDANQVMETLAAADIAYTVEPNSASRFSTRIRGSAPASSWRRRVTVAAWKASWLAPFPA